MVTAAPARTRVVPLTLSRTALSRVALVAFVGALCFLLLLPVYHLQKLALADGARGYRTAFGSPSFPRVLATTITLALASVALAMVMGTALAIAATRLPRRLRFLQVVPVLPIILPPVATVIGWGFLLSPVTGYINTWLRLLPWWSDRFQGPIDINSMTWIIIITGIALSAFVYLFVSGGIRNISSELVEAAQVCGSSYRGAVVHIVLPLLRPVLVYAFGVVLLLGLGQFTSPLLLGRQHGINVLSTEMYARISGSPTDYGAAAALGSPLLVFGLAVVIFQRFVLGDSRRFVTHGGKAFRSTQRPSVVGAVMIALYGIVAIVLPLLALLNTALSKFWTGRIAASDWTLFSVRQALADSRLKDAVITSLVASTVAVLISLPLGFVAASLLHRGSRFPFIRTATDILVGIPLAVPAVVLGMGFLATYTTGPFVLYGTRWVIILVYLSLMVPYTTRMQLSSMVALGDAYTEASHVSGAGSLRTNASITLPLLRPALGGAAGLMFVLLAHEFSASLLVRAPTTQVMGTLLFDYYSNGNYPWVATMALIMALVTAVGITFAVLLGGRRVFDRM